MTLDTDDWSHWLDAHGAALVLFASQWAANVGDAEDVVQDAFVRFWKARDRVADPKPYLFACVRRAALDRLRSDRRRTKREERVARPETADGLFQSAPEQAERQAMIEAALTRLPDEQRAVLVLKIWGGLTFPQIAAALDVPANTAASRYRYALARLRELLAEAKVP
ncbi:MAG TPA: sigma-70 family RNA polymerase sigma factor [Gemmataceae bacterium]|jgi:RNA polymerase sigma-70 factor (ECF subfamily)|nr:sigma-70 family RNA polymerase sigma factor [Gemmataceae bacterium]